VIKFLPVDSSGVFYSWLEDRSELLDGCHFRSAIWVFLVVRRRVLLLCLERRGVYVSATWGVARSAERHVRSGHLSCTRWGVERTRDRHLRRVTPYGVTLDSVRGNDFSRRVFGQSFFIYFICCLFLNFLFEEMLMLDTRCSPQYFLLHGHLLLWQYTWSHLRKF
jgi:hypothetical protein